jgi:hypothetical protein
MREYLTPIEVTLDELSRIAHQDPQGYDVAKELATANRDALRQARAPVDIDFNLETEILKTYANQNGYKIVNPKEK